MNKTIAIAGGGASGVLLAHHLLHEFDDTRVVLYEPGELGTGAAYATTCRLHVLNVAAVRMSAFPDEPRHFVNWLDRRYPNAYAPTSFVPRLIYGEYLRSIADALIERFGDRFRHERSRLTNVSEAAFADAVVLATGNAAPAPWPGAPDSARYVPSAWAPAALVPERANEAVLILGSGLTAVDAILGLRANGHRGHIYVVSRRGLLPNAHGAFEIPPEVPMPRGSLRAVFASVRSQTRNDWRLGIDALRPWTNAIWRQLDASDQRRFLRHAADHWNAHRHRMAPEIADSISKLRTSGVVEIVAGRTVAFDETAGALSVGVRELSTQRERVLNVQRAINCGGPEQRVDRIPNPLLRSLLADGLMRPSAAGRGIDTAEEGALIDVGGNASSRLFALGPIRFGTLLESIAMPEIRVQARDLARHLGERAGTGSHELQGRLARHAEPTR
jgi:uncharacterized NAD(P)/FAD-binding protein YdhS